MIRRLATGCRLLLAGVWLYAGATKVSDLAAATRAVKAYQLLPNPVAEVVGAALPMVELALGLLLLLGLATRFAAAASAVLMAGFVAGIAAAWSRGLRIDCGCFGGGGQLGAGESPNYWLDLARDGLLLVAAVVLVSWPRTRWSVDGWLAARPALSADDAQP
ncbi:MAG TPA: MauE/DoxX family redox-associated membrane protein [Natronosporangium sp.]